MEKIFSLTKKHISQKNLNPLLKDCLVWPAEAAGAGPQVVYFRRKITLEKALRARVHITADQRFDLYINGLVAARGPERGDPDHWFVHSYDLNLPEGTHTIIARCWWLGPMGPLAQMTRGQGGFAFFAEGAAGDILTTTASLWEAHVSQAYRFKRPWITWGTQADTFIDGTKLSADMLQMNDLEWTALPVRKLEPKPDRWGLGAGMFCPSELPDMLNAPVVSGLIRHAEILPDRESALKPLHIAHSRSDLAESMNRLLSDGCEVTVPANTCVQWLLDLDDYFCAYPQLKTRGGAGSSVQIHWAESLYHPPHSDNRKGNRDETEGKIIHADGDTFYPDGRELTFDLLWWRSGRYVQILIETGKHPLILTGLAFFETRYPLKIKSRFSASDPQCEQIIPLMIRALEMCMHETYMDCPYYEQLMYIGDTRTEVLTTYVLSNDERLPRKALKCFDWSRLPDGLTQSRYPSFARQMIPTFSLWWICMVRDYMMWRGDLSLTASLLPGVHAVLDGFGQYCGEDYLLRAVPGWNFVDWSGKSQKGYADEAGPGANGLVNLQYVLALQAAAALERAVGSSAMARIYEQKFKAVRAAVIRKFWNAKKRLFADDEKQRVYSEHMQCLAVLAGACDAMKKKSIRETLLKPNRLDRATIYFSHYLFEALVELNAMPYFFERLKTWTALPEAGFRTLPESPEPARSDCHAWGAHPLYHFSTKLLGVMPSSPGFASVKIEPYPCHLTHVSGTVPHPKGDVRVVLDIEQGIADITLPKGLRGTFKWKGRTRALKAGNQRCSLGSV